MCYANSLTNRSALDPLTLITFAGDLIPIQGHMKSLVAFNFQKRAEVAKNLT